MVYTAACFFFFSVVCAFWRLPPFEVLDLGPLVKNCTPCACAWNPYASFSSSAVYPQEIKPVILIGHFPFPAFSINCSDASPAEPSSDCSKGRFASFSFLQLPFHGSPVTRPPYLPVSKIYFSSSAGIYKISSKQSTFTPLFGRGRPGQLDQNKIPTFFLMPGGIFSPDSGHTTHGRSPNL